ncbi:MAG: mannose-6-phosphate isomerase, partial [Candidatus Nanopelagicaceae bacterium]
MLEKSDRPWGRYEVLQESPSHKVKCIWVSPGKRLSYQRHQKR